MTQQPAIALPDGSEGTPVPARRRVRRPFWQRVRHFRLELAPAHYLIIFLALVLVAIAPGTAQVWHAERAAELPTRQDDSERAERNFPGSAFYFLDPATLAQAAGQPADAGTAAEDGTILSAGPAARPFVMTRSGGDYARALKCLTDAVYYEAATEPDAGQRAVAQVVLNRVRHPSYPNTVCGVVYQGSERATGCQFSFSCDGSMARQPARLFYARAGRVAADALAGAVHTPAGLATHYHTTEVHPYWAPSLHFLGTIGAHRFYRWQGSAGLPSAFFARYAGREPNPWPLPRAAPAVLAQPAPDPLMLQRQFEALYESARLKALADAEAATRQGSRTGAAALAGLRPDSIAPITSHAAPAYAPAAVARGGEAAFAANRLPGSDAGAGAGSGSVRAEYAASGSWKAQPAQ